MPWMDNSHKTSSYTKNMSKVRDIVTDKSKKSPSGWNSWIRAVQKSLVLKINTGLSYGRMGYMVIRYVGWFVVTTGMITALPLVMEIKREAFIEELEQAQIAAALAEGRTPQELANNGLTSAIGPKVIES